MLKELSMEPLQLLNSLRFPSAKIQTNWSDFALLLQAELSLTIFISIMLSGSSLCTVSHYRWTWHVAFGMCFAEMERRRYSGQVWEFWGCTRMFYCRWISSIVHSSFLGCLKTLLHTHSSPASQTHRWSVTTAGGTRWEIHAMVEITFWTFLESNGQLFCLDKSTFTASILCVLNTHSSIIFNIIWKVKWYLLWFSSHIVCTLFTLYSILTLFGQN